MKLKHILAGAALLAPMAMMAQNINFEEKDYKSLGVYDTWEASPFRTGELKGNYKVIDNHLSMPDEVSGQVMNDSKKILAVQRSRFGSNTFGVRIDLKEPFMMPVNNKYIHVQVYRPYEGRIMVVGLGKRQDRPGQSPETEQFWAMSTNDVQPNRWVEVVLPFRGNEGIDIYSLVVVPDCESPHLYTNDEICYIDNIVVNTNPSAQFTDKNYPVNFELTSKNERDDRFFDGISLEGSADGTQSVTAPDSKRMTYYHITDKKLTARPGETLQPTFQWRGIWMHSYVYLDRGCDGRFDVEVTDDGYAKPNTDLVAFSFFGPEKKAQNSNGESVAKEATFLNPPAFKLPADVKEGFYRMRYKVEWNCVDAGGDPKAAIVGDGGGIFDIDLNVHAEMCSVSDANRNGEVLAAKDGVKLDKYQAPFMREFTFRMHPEHGFEYKGAVVRHGHKLDGPAVLHGVRQWKDEMVERRYFNDKDEYTIPAEWMDGDVRIEGLFIEEGTYVEPVIPTRYATTSITADKQFADTTSWYTIQIAQDGYVLADNNGSSYIALNNTSVDEEDPAQLWCFVGNEEVGYKLYNKQAGPTKVLAAPTNMGSNTGAGVHPILYEEESIPAGYVAVWRFEDSKDLGSSRVEHAYMYEDGFPANKVNNRDNKLAFWDGGADAGSTLQIFFVKKDVPETTGITAPEVVRPQDNVFYDLSGCRVNEPHHGIFIQNGKKVVVD